MQHLIKSLFALAQGQTQRSKELNGKKRITHYGNRTVSVRRK